MSKPVDLIRLPRVVACLAPCLATLALAFGAATARAAPVAITNAGFEANATTDGAFTVLVPTGWQLYDPGGVINQNANAVGVIRPNVANPYFPGGAPEGAQAALVFLSGPDGEAGLQQTLADVLQPDTFYTLTVAVGNIASGTSLPGSADGGGTFYNLAGFPGYRIELLAGGVVLASDSISAGVIPEGEWRDAGLGFDSSFAPASWGQALSIRLVNPDLPGTAQAPAIEVDFDNVRLVAQAVPEPGTLPLWLAGLALLAWRARDPRPGARAACKTWRSNV